ncbi:flagellar biosynthesis protein FlhA [Schlesneria paludicola]|uniref:flagellar biosynthesis protein FlhA n=1 Tax=Schlesneria paludicola TaxID=360056 RepID=UPI00029B0726|nr:flagellar biosynthesis protein FlhA [Schlesneria paludicola]
MPTDNGRGSRTAGGQSFGLVFPILIVLSVLVLVAPVPPIVLDLLLAANVTASVLVLLTTISVRQPLEFSVFPTLLLVTTLVRLVLNVASTRLILTRAHIAGTDAAGAVIEAFGQFVAQGQLLVGLILFCIVVVIQFVVVTKGSTRISEVAARFALDGMPGKQLAIDADLTAGFITAEQARERRAEIVEQADFYAAMDGAGKFVRGDAMAGILITLINLIGGMAIGVLQHHMSVGRALEVFATLTIGDGLVSQVSGFLIALAAGLLATRSSRESNLSQNVLHQLFRDPTSLLLAAAFSGGLAFTGLPMLPLLGLGLGCALLAWHLKQSALDATRTAQATPSSNVKTKLETAESPQPSAQRLNREVRPEDKLNVEPIELELGFRLIKLADPDAGGDLMERVTQLRTKIAQELGIILPKVKIRDCLRLKDSGYQIKLRDITVAAGDLRVDSLLAINPGGVSGELTGVEVVDPASGRPAVWIEPALAEQAKMFGYRVVEPAVVLISHLTDIVKSHSDELLTRQQVHQLLENLRRTSPKVVDELIPDLLKPSHVHQILCNLLRERVPVRDLETILQTLGDCAERTKDLAILTERTRQALSRTICQQYRDPSRTLRAITLDPALEDVLAGGFEFSERGLRVKLTPQVIDGVVQELTRQVKLFLRAGYPPVVICTPAVRPILRQITQASLSKLAVLSLNEVTRDTQVQPRGQVPINAIKLNLPRDVDQRLRQPLAALAAAH